MIYEYRYTVEVTEKIRPRVYLGSDGSWAGRWGPRSIKGSESEVNEWCWGLAEVIL